MSNTNKRRHFLAKAVALGATFTLSMNAFAGCFGKGSGTKFPRKNIESLPSLEDRSILITWGGWNGHEPRKFIDYLVPWLKDNGAKVQVFNTLDPYLDKDLMGSIDLVVQIFTMSRITDEQEKGLINAVRNGVGMAGWHGGMCDAFRANVKYQYMTGGQWVAHPGGVIDYEVDIIDERDAVTSGLSRFAMRSEQYFMHVDPNVKVLASTTFNNKNDDWIGGCVMPVVWKKMYGKGRIFFTSLGHNLSHVTDSEHGMEIIKRGIRWASASKYEEPEKWISPAYLR